MVCLLAKTLSSRKYKKSSCTLDATHFTSMAASHNRFSAVAEHNLFLVKLQQQYPLKSSVRHYQSYPTTPFLTASIVPVWPT